MSSAEHILAPGLGSSEAAAPAAAQRRRAVWLLPLAFTISWVVFVLLGGHWDRVLDHWRSSLTMVFGSFVAGSTPQGGGAVAFPVFTKVLSVPPEVARSFSVTIQASGMVMASLTILLAGRRIDKRALGLGLVGGTVGLLFGAFVLGDSSRPFWPSQLDAAYVKVTFTVLIFAVFLIVKKCATETAKATQVEHWGGRAIFVMLVFGFVGGVLTALTGSGVDVLLFVFVVLVAKVSPKVAIPTSIVAMAGISIVAAVLFGLIDGQLDVTRAGADVVAVGGAPFGPEAATRFDLFGLWLAAAPVVVWGAPFGSWVADRASERTVIRFVGLMAMAEVITTIAFLDRLRSDVALALFGIAGLVAAWLFVRGLGRLSGWLMAD